MKTLNEYDEEELKELDEKLNQYSHDYKMYQRILAVKMVTLGRTRIEVANFLNVNRQTVGRWVKLYNENGIEGLEPDYSNCGQKCRLTDEQLIELKEIITDPNEHYDIKRTMKLIEDRYGVIYSYKQTWEIITKKLDLNYRKPYIRYHEAPEDAEEQFKKNIPN